MIHRKKNSMKRTYVFTILILLSLLIYISKINSNIPNDVIYKEDFEKLNLSDKVDHLDILWLDNPLFEDPIEPTWFSNIEGDSSDVDATTSPGQVNFEILGNMGMYSNVSGIPNASHWQEYNNTYFILPDDLHEINENGCEAAHTFQETTDQSRNRPSVHWRRNITTPVDMSDYIITSVSLSAIVNGSADTNVETPTANLDIGEPTYSGFATYYDFARFYIKISNLDYENLYEVAYYQTVDLGKGNQTRQGSGTVDYLNDALMTIINESNLIFYLTKALENDPYHFGITLGIDIYCEDNYDQADLDNFYSLLIKSVNLSFSYEKKIDQLTSVSWNQIGNMINGSNVEITKANLTFQYRIDKLWSDSLSPNSEFRILINNIQHTETIKLSSASTSFQDANIGGFDLTDITPPYENITLSIQVILGDEFGLNRSITLSIDNVYLEISYTETFPDPSQIPEPLIFRLLLIIASVIAVCLGSYLVAYQRILKYPKTVRKVRKYKRTLRKNNAPSIDITDRKKAFKKAYKTETSGTSKFLKGKPTEKLTKTKSIVKSPKNPNKKSPDLVENEIKKKGGTF